MDGVNEQKIEKYKKMLYSMFIVRNIEMLDMITKNRESLVNMDLQNAKITQEEAAILQDYIQELAQQVKKEWETNTRKREGEKQQKQKELDNKIKENIAIFHERLKVIRTLPDDKQEKPKKGEKVIEYRDILGKGTSREHSKGMEL